MNSLAAPYRTFTESDLNIIADSDDGWILCLPPKLKGFQAELEELLGKVFANRERSAENFALAQQLSLNWCASKCRQSGMSLEECLL